jgi:hypothetical protein
VQTDVARARGARSIVVLDCGLFGVDSSLSESIVKHPRAHGGDSVSSRSATTCLRA